MGIGWNPTWPDQIGVERKAVGYGSDLIALGQQWQELTFTALHSGPVTALEIFGQGPLSNLDSRYMYLGRPLIVDLYTGDGNVFEQAQLSSYTVSSVTGSSHMFNENLSQPITPSRINDVDGLFLAASTLYSYASCQFDTAAFPLTRRILSARVIVRANGTFYITRIDQPPNSAIWQQGWPISNNVMQTAIYETGDAVVLFPNAEWTWWTPQRIRDMQTGGPIHWQIACGAIPGAWRCDLVRLEVVWCNETRLGSGIAAPDGSFQWMSFPMRTPAATGVPSLVAGQQYTAVVRHPQIETANHGVAQGQFNWRNMVDAPLVTGWDGIQLPVNNVSVTGSVTTPPKIYQPVDRSPIPVELETKCLQIVSGGPSKTGGQVQETAMPYNLSRGAYVHNGEGGFAKLDASQFITVTGAATSMPYGQTIAVAGWSQSAPPPDDAVLTAEVWTATGAPEIRVFSPVSRTKRDIESLQPATPFFSTSEMQLETRLIRFRHPETLMLPAGRYEIRLSSDVRLLYPFYVNAMIALEQPINQTFGRSTDFAQGAWPFFPGSRPLTGAGGGVTYSSDVQLTLAAVPPAITGVALFEGVQTAHSSDVCTPGGSCHGCAEEGVPFVQIMWTPTSDLLSTYYEVQRQDVTDGPFRTVQYVDGRLDSTWNDFESALGIPVCYRIRSGRPDGITGDWSEPECITLPGGQVGLSFTSNAATGMGVIAPEIWDTETITREWEFQEYEDVNLVPIYSRERQVAFHPLERKGVIFSRVMLLNALCTVYPPTLNVFAPLRVLSWAPIPYVCVRDGEGNRWYANVRVPRGTNVRGGEQWFVEVIVAEVSDTGTPGRTSDAQPEVAALMEQL